MTVELEDRWYDADSTPEEIHAIRARVEWMDPPNDDVILYREVPRVNVFSIDTQWDRIVELSKGRQHYMLIDLFPVVKSPGAEGRARIRAGFEEIKGSLIYCAVATGKNMVMNAMASFIMARLGLKDFTVHKTKELALEAINNAKQRRNR